MNNFFNVYSVIYQKLPHKKLEVAVLFAQPKILTGDMQASVVKTSKKNNFFDGKVLQVFF